MFFGLCVIFRVFRGLCIGALIGSSIWSCGGIYIRIPVKGSTLNTSPCLVLALKISYPIVNHLKPLYWMLRVRI